AKANSSVAITWANSSYNGVANAAGAIVNGIPGESDLTPFATLTYYTGGFPVSGSALTDPQSVVEAYTVVANFGGNGNYKTSTDHATITISPANSAVAITWSNSTYGGSANSASAVVNGVDGESDLTPHATLTYYTGGFPVSGSAL